MAQADLQKEISKAKAQLKDELVNMTIAATEKVLNRKLDKDSQNELILDFAEN